MIDEKYTVEARVAKGAAFLDQKDPEWFLKIDPALLDLESTCNCVLGQLGAEAARLTSWGESAFDYMLWDSAWGPELVGRTRAMGFNCLTNPDLLNELYPDIQVADEDERWSALMEADFKALEAEWMRVIKDRCNV